MTQQGNATLTIPPAVLDAATARIMAAQGYDEPFVSRQLWAAESGAQVGVSWMQARLLAQAALEAVNIAHLQAAADALPGLVAALKVIVDAAENDLVCHCGDYIRGHLGSFGGCNAAVPMYQPAAIDYSLIENAQRAIRQAKQGGAANAVN